MRILRILALTFIYFVLEVVVCSGQPWAPFLDSSRATTWQGTAGFAIPNYTVACPTAVSLTTGSGAASANGTSINNALASCDATHNVVNIPAGTWYTTGITAQTGTSVMRGAGANSTTLIITTSAGCGGLGAGICLTSSDATFGGDSAVLPPSGNRQCLWTAGYAQGTTSITLNSCPSPPTSGRTLVLDQANDTSDTGGIYICDGNNGVTNCNGEGAGSPVGRNISGVLHTQTQVTHMTAVSGSGTGPYTVTISPGVYFNNIRTGQAPGAWWNGSVVNMGVENLTIDRTGFFLGDSNIAINNCDKCWVKNVRSEWAGRNHVWVYLSSNAVIRDSYFYQDQSHASESYGIEQTQSSGVLIENNIFQQLSVPTMFGPGSGSVVDYNLAIDNAFPAPNMALANAAHSAGNGFNLWEGNVMNGINSDDSWGGSDTGTWFRNFLVGWQPGYTQYTYPISIESNNRAFNLVGNVLGQPSYQVTYEGYATSPSAFVNGGNTVLTAIYTLGFTGFAGWGGCTMSGTASGCDSVVRPTLMRWGNWDVVTNAAKFDSTEASPASVAFVNANFTSSYFNTLAHTLPASLLYSSTPSWWPGGKAWPPIGPDVSSGNTGVCTGTFAGSQGTNSSQCTGGTLSTAWASHVTSIPAVDCFLTTMSGPPDGSGSVLAFDASTCYSATPPGTTSVSISGMKLSGTQGWQ